MKGIVFVIYESGNKKSTYRLNADVLFSVLLNS